MRKLKHLVVLDRIILLDRQWDELRSMAEALTEYAGLSQKEILRRLQEEADKAEAPMCWTQLAKEEMKTEEICERVKGADAIITCWTNIPDKVLLENSNLEFIGFWTNLVDHRVNRELADTLGIRIAYVPDYGTDSVAEMTIAGMLAVSRRILINARDTRRGSWAYELLKTGSRVPSLDQIPQRMLKGKRLGLVGFGRIGQRVAEIAQAFGMDVNYWSRNVRGEWDEQGVRYSPLDEIFRCSDIVSVHLSPYSRAGIVTAELLSSLRDGAIFINTSAGRLVDQEALWKQLKTGRITAYVDVYESLPPKKEIKQLTGRNLFTYRAGWFTQEAVTYKGDELLRRVREFLHRRSSKDTKVVS